MTNHLTKQPLLTTSEVANSYRVGEPRLASCRRRRNSTGTGVGAKGISDFGRRRSKRCSRLGGAKRVKA